MSSSTRRESPKQGTSICPQKCSVMSQARGPCQARSQLPCTAPQQEAVRSDPEAGGKFLLWSVLVVSDSAAIPQAQLGVDRRQLTYLFPTWMSNQTKRPLHGRKHAFMWAVLQQDAHMHQCGHNLLNLTSSIIFSFIFVGSCASSKISKKS